MEKYGESVDLEVGLAAGAGLGEAVDVCYGTVDAGGADEEIGAGAVQDIDKNADGGGLEPGALAGRDASPAAEVQAGALAAREASPAADVAGGELARRDASLAADVAGALAGREASPGADVASELAARDASLAAGVAGALASREASLAAAVAAELAGRDANPAAAEGVRIKRVLQESDPLLRWAFLRRVHITLALQFLVTSAIAAAACKVLSVPRFFHIASDAATILSVAGPISIILAMLPLRAYQEEYPFNMLLLGVFTLCKAFNATMVSANVNGKIFLETTFLVAVLFISFTLYTYWAAHRGYAFTFMFPFLFTSIMVVMVYVVIQIFYPPGSVRATIGGCIATVAYSAFILQSTNLIVQRYTCDEFLAAAIQLSMDVNI